MHGVNRAACLKTYLVALRTWYDWGKAERGWVANGDRGMDPATISLSAFTVQSVWMVRYSYLFNLFTVKTRENPNSLRKH